MVLLEWKRIHKFARGRQSLLFVCRLTEIIYAAWNCNVWKGKNKCFGKNGIVLCLQRIKTWIRTRKKINDGICIVTEYGYDNGKQGTYINGMFIA